MGHTAIFIAHTDDKISLFSKTKEISSIHLTKIDDFKDVVLGKKSNFVLRKCAKKSFKCLINMNAI